MSDEPNHNHFYVTPAMLPQPTDTDTQWVQRVTMLAEISEEVMKTLHGFLRINAPILLDEALPTYHLIAGLGFILRGIQLTGRTQLEKSGTAPLDPEDEQARIIRDELARPDLDLQLREALLTLLSHQLDRSAKPPADSEWPADGFVIGGE